MPDERDALAAPQEWSEIARRIRARTPARILIGRAGASYRTGTQLDLREAHAAARDAVLAEFDLETALGADLVKRWGLFEVCSQAKRKDIFLLRPELGRHFDEPSRSELQSRCPAGTDLQIVIGDGLSVPAVAAQIPSLLPLIYMGAQERGWTVGQVFVVRHCRVGILNEIGELLNPKVALLLIGERPGLATDESLSAYMAYRPGKTQTDADRNLISNIHARGTKPGDAAARILNFVAHMMRTRASGYGLREDLTALDGERKLPSG
jgi:ethanolamine ammonia-lyase small subunit